MLGQRAARDRGRQRFGRRGSMWVDKAHPALEWDTVLPNGAKLDSSRPRQHQLLGRSGLGWPETANGRGSENLRTEGWAPTWREVRKRLGAECGRESATPGNGGFQRVLVTTSRLHRLVRGIFLAGPAA